MWDAVSHHEMKLGSEAMSGDLRVPLVDVEQSDLLIWSALGQRILPRLNQTWCPAVVPGNVKGLAIRDFIAKTLCDYATKFTFLLSLNRYIKPLIGVEEFDLHVHSLDFA